MYDSYYNSKKSTSTKINNKTQANKSTPQYLFLNLIRILSIVYLVLTVLYIPIFLGIGEINSNYWNQNKESFGFIEKLFLQGTIFAIKNYEVCYDNILEKRKVIITQNSTQNTSVPFQCFENKLRFLPFVQSVQTFHNFYFAYFMVIYLLFFCTIIIAEYQGQKLHIDLQYPYLLPQNIEKLQRKKLICVEADTDLRIYMLKPLLQEKIKSFFANTIQIQQQNKVIVNIKLSLNQKLKQYVQLQFKAQAYNQKLKYMEQTLIKVQTQQDQTQLRTEMLSLNQEITKLNLQMAYLQLQLQKKLQTHSLLHYKYLWIHLSKFSDLLRIKKYVSNSRTTDQFETKNMKLGIGLMKLQFKNIDFQDVIFQNIQYQSIAEYQNQQLSQTKYSITNKRYRLLANVYRWIKSIFGVILTLALMLIVDILILIIQKTRIFSFSTILVVLVLQIGLKLLIVKITEAQKNIFISNQKLSIMLKLTIFVYFNLALMIIVANHDLGAWNLGKIISTYQFNQINEEWFLKIGTDIITIVIYQIFFSNLRVYVKVFKDIFLVFISKRFFELLKLKKVKQRMQIWIEDLKTNYKRPVMDIQGSYSQILPIYMLGLTFGYLFPIIYPLLFIFSITIYHSHKNYVELYTQKFPSSTTKLNDAAFTILFVSFLGGLIFILFVQRDFWRFLLIEAGIIILLWVIKLIISNRQLLQIQRIEQLQKIESQNDRIDLITQRNLLSSDIHNSNDLEKSQVHLRFKKSFIGHQIMQKQTQIRFVQIFYRKSHYINQIHSQFYDRYTKMLIEELHFLRDIQQKIKSLKNSDQ